MKYITQIIPAVLILFFSAVIPASAFEGMIMAAPHDMEREVQALTAQWGPLNIYRGEIREIGPGKVELMTENQERSISFDESVRVFINGRFGNWRGLRPVAKGFYLLARIWVDGFGKARLIEARYEGGSVQILAVKRLSDGRYCLAIQGAETETSNFQAVETADGCAGLQNGLAENYTGEAFVLFDFDGRVRAVLFP